MSEANTPDVLDDLSSFADKLLGDQNIPRPSKAVPHIPENLEDVSSKEMQSLIGRYTSWFEYLSVFRRGYRSALRETKRRLAKVRMVKLIEFEGVKPQKLQEAYISEDPVVSELTASEAYIEDRLHIITDELDRLRRGQSVLKQATYLRRDGGVRPGTWQKSISESSKKWDGVKIPKRVPQKTEEGDEYFPDTR